MTVFEAYKIYNALKLHFGSGSYDYFKYNGGLKLTEASLYKSRDKYHFEKLRRKYQNKQDFESFCMANFVHGETYIRDFTHDTYIQHKKTFESLEYCFKKDLLSLVECDTIHNTIKVADGQHPIILKKLLGGDITIESFIVLDEILNFSPYFDKKIQEPFIWKGVNKKCVAMKPFLKPYINNTYYKQIAYDINTRI